MCLSRNGQSHSTVTSAPRLTLCQSNVSLHRLPCRGVVPKQRGHASLHHAPGADRLSRQHVPELMRVARAEAPQRRHCRQLLRWDVTIGHRGRRVHAHHGHGSQPSHLRSRLGQCHVLVRVLRGLLSGTCKCALRRRSGNDRFLPGRPILFEG